VIALDTSAIVAIALEEREAGAFAEVIASESCLIGWPTVLESHMVLKSIPFRRGLEVLDKVLNAPRIRVLSFDEHLFAAARGAFDQFGRGHHQAKLNFGDCMSYAVAKLRNVPLLFKGDDFPLTDIRAAR
jgi:ribonuclease VapC